MLHVITEIGKPGRNEREKRHFPELLNAPSTPVYKPHGRRYIPHGLGFEDDFKPHPYHIEPEYTECGPDWKSRLRRIPSPHNPKYITEIWPDAWKGLRTYPWMSRKTDKEWQMYPEGPGYDATLRCTINGVHKASQRSFTEITPSMLLGKCRPVVNKRNGIPVAAPGDKNYQVVEYSPSFHAVGSTRPVVNFGGPPKSQADTFIPLQRSSTLPLVSYCVKEKHRKRAQEIDLVRSLERWRPATPLIPPTPPPQQVPPTIQESEA